MKKVSIKDLKKKKKGFTLIELIVVIAIIAILAAMAIPKLSEMKKNARVSNDVATAKNIHTIVAMLNANGDADAAEGKTIASTNSKVKDKLDGKVASDGKSEYAKQPFQAEIKANGDIVVTCNGKELYPDASGAGRAAYAS